jgi:dTDP-4-dehydrorhamnose reductase/UDP-glucose 4-epimerase
VAAAKRGTGRVLVVGRNSFIARHFLAISGRQITAVSHDSIDRPGLFDGIDRLISFARHPLCGSEEYRPEAMDPDLRLAERIAGRGIDYVMLSSRKVYAPSARPLAETDPTGPQDLYAQHKLEVENALREGLGERLTVLRLANIFGYERGQDRRRSFFSRLLERLARDGQIRFDMSPFVERDFLPVEACARVLARIVAAPPGRVLNVGSGIALPTGRLALWVLEGYGRGELVIESPREHDAFVLDVGELTRRYGPLCTYDDLRASCLELGRRLAGETGQR